MHGKMWEDCGNYGKTLGKMETFVQQMAVAQPVGMIYPEIVGSKAAVIWRKTVMKNRDLQQVYRAIARSKIA